MIAAIYNILFSLITIKYLAKPLTIVFLILSAIVSYQMYYYGIIFDDEMIRNIFETNLGESTSFVNLHIIIWVALLGIIPTTLILKTTIVYQTFFKEVFYKIISIFISLFVIFIIYTLYFKDISSIARNHKHLHRYIVPTYFTASFIKYIDIAYFKTKVPYIKLGLDAKLAKNNSRKNNLLIVIVGETARSKNYELNGYSRDTNKHTKPYNIISFQNVNSCGTATAISVPCMFSTLPRKQYSHDKAYNQDNLIDILKRSGLNLKWIDNDNGCKGVCDNITTINIPSRKKNKWCNGLSCVDEALVDEAKTQFNNLPVKDSVIFLHLIGSHGPTYYERYPKEHRIYLPDCQRSDMQNCTKEQLINSYDNTIAYSDYVMSELIKLLKQKEQKFNTAFLYVSDHGESLGEYGLYLHGAPYFIAPEEQTKVPMLMWFSESFIAENNINLNKLKNNAKNSEYSHDNFFHSIIGLMGVQTNIYDKKLDIFRYEVTDSKKLK